VPMFLVHPRCSDSGRQANSTGFEGRVPSVSDAKDSRQNSFVLILKIERRVWTSRGRGRCVRAGNRGTGQLGSFCARNLVCDDCLRLCVGKKCFERLGDAERALARQWSWRQLWHVTTLLSVSVSRLPLPHCLGIGGGRSSSASFSSLDVVGGGTTSRKYSGSVDVVSEEVGVPSRRLAWVRLELG